MKKIILIFAAIAMIVSLSTKLMAQDTHEAGDVVTYQMDAMRIMDIEGTAPTLTLAKPLDAGAAIPDVTSELSYIQYTSIVATGTTNRITAALGGAGTLPSFTTLKVLAAAASADGEGNKGTPTTVVTLTAEAQPLIGTIGSCYTGTGASKGHKLTYTWGIDATEYDDAVSVSSATDVTVLYTIIATL